MPRGTVTVKGVECLSCHRKFSGSRNAIAHAKGEGHYRFKNVDVRRERVNPETYGDKK